MKNYIVANYSIDPLKEGQYHAYPEEAVKSVTKYWGRVLAATPSTQFIEGDAGNITVILEFNSIDDAIIWYNSDEYKAIKHLRVDSSTSGWLLAAEGFEA